MPEGDTILRTARTLERAIGGRTITGARALDRRLRPAALVGKKVVRVEARGKHVLIELDDGRVVHSHMGMTGSWHVYRPGERWRAAEHLARLVLETDAFVAVCFRAPQIDLVERAGGAAADPRLARLGPDVLAPDFDPEAAARRLATRDGIIGDALLDQTALAGVGNIWRSEALFVAKIHPETPVAALSGADLARLARTASELLAKSVGPTGGALPAERGAVRRFVYARKDLACRRCGTRIEARRVGRLARTAYFCPFCQPAPSR